MSKAGTRYLWQDSKPDNGMIAQRQDSQVKSWLIDRQFLGFLRGKNDIGVIGKHLQAPVDVI